MATSNIDVAQQLGRGLAASSIQLHRSKIAGLQVEILRIQLNAVKLSRRLRLGQRLDSAPGVLPLTSQAAIKRRS